MKPPVPAQTALPAFQSGGLIREVRVYFGGEV